MSSGPTMIELRIGRLTVEDGALGGLSRAALGEEVRGAIARQLAGEASAGGTFAALAARVVAEIAAAMPPGTAHGGSAVTIRASRPKGDTK